MTAETDEQEKKAAPEKEVEQEKTPSPKDEEAPPQNGKGDAVKKIDDEDEEKADVKEEKDEKSEKEKEAAEEDGEKEDEIVPKKRAPRFWER